jgi:hypothetical protein
MQAHGKNCTGTGTDITSVIPGAIKTFKKIKA